MFLVHPHIHTTHRSTHACWKYSVVKKSYCDLQPVAVFSFLLLSDRSKYLKCILQIIINRLSWWNLMVFLFMWSAWPEVLYWFASSKGALVKLCLWTMWNQEFLWKKTKRSKVRWKLSLPRKRTRFASTLRIVSFGF